jgi:hypothetical protein
MRALLTFYRNFAVPSVLVSALGCLMLVKSGNPLFLVYAFWMKVFTSVLLGLYVFFFRSRYHVFYHNLGFNTGQLYGFSFLLDFGIWILMSILCVLLWL